MEILPKRMIWGYPDVWKPPKCCSRNLLTHRWFEWCKAPVSMVDFFPKKEDAKNKRNCIEINPRNQPIVCGCWLPLELSYSQPKARTLIPFQNNTQGRWTKNNQKLKWIHPGCIHPKHDIKGVPSSQREMPRPKLHHFDLFQDTFPQRFSAKNRCRKMSTPFIWHFPPRQHKHKKEVSFKICQWHSRCNKTTC